MICSKLVLFQLSHIQDQLRKYSAEEVVHHSKIFIENFINVNNGGLLDQYWVLLPEKNSTKNLFYYAVIDIDEESFKRAIYIHIYTYRTVEGGLPYGSLNQVALRTGQLPASEQIANMTT